MNLWRLEWIRLNRTRRLLLLVGVFVFFAISGPITTRYLPEILERFGAGIQITMPEPTAARALAEFMSNALQIGVLAVAFVAAAALAFDANREMAVFLRTRATIASIVAPRFVVSAGASVAALILGAAVAFLGVGVLFDWPNPGRFVVAVALIALYLVFTVALAAFVSSFVRGVPAVALITVGILVLLGLLSLVPNVGRWLPSALAGGFDAIIAGGDFTYWPSIGATLLAIGAMLGLAVVRLEVREV
jgi:ABC-2 type transport system permease protein